MNGASIDVNGVNIAIRCHDKFVASSTAWPGLTPKVGPFRLRRLKRNKKQLASDLA